MDDRVALAISHWGPRFVTNGVTLSDFTTLTSTIDHWDDWCSAWCTAAELYEEQGRAALAEGRMLSAGTHLARAALYFHFAKFMFVHDIDQMRGAHRRAVACLTQALPHLDPAARRIEIPFEGTTLAGILRTPRAPGPHPAVLMLSGLDSAKEELRSTERLFLDRGLATFAVDGPGQGEAEYTLPIRPDWEVPAAAMVDTLAAQPEIDAERIGVWGVSLGGYYAPRAASGEHRIKACIALAGPWNFGAGWDQMNELTREAFRVRSGCATDALARTRACELTLAGRASQITCPLLVVAGKKDRIIDWHDAVRLADEVGEHAELLLLDNGNHGCMNVAPLHRPAAADWMASRLEVALR